VGVSYERGTPVSGPRARRAAAGSGIDLTESVYNLVCKRQFPLKSVNLFFILVIIKVKLTDLCGN